MSAARFASKTSACAAISALCSSSAATNTWARAFAYSSSAQGAIVSRHSISAGSSVSAWDGPAGTWSPHRCLAAVTASASGAISAASRATSAVPAAAAARAAATSPRSAAASRKAVSRRCSATAQAVRSVRRATAQSRRFRPRRTPPASATDSAPRECSAARPWAVTVFTAGRASWCAPRAASEAPYSSSAADTASRAAGSRTVSSASLACASSASQYASSQASSSPDRHVSAAATRIRSVARDSALASADLNQATAACQSTALPFSWRSAAVIDSPAGNSTSVPRTAPCHQRSAKARFAALSPSRAASIAHAPTPSDRRAVEAK